MKDSRGIRRKLIAALALIAAVFWSPGCGRTTSGSVAEAAAGQQELAVRLKLPSSWQIVNLGPDGGVQQLDTDADGDLEWVLLYSFDELNNPSFTPVNCVIYDVAYRERKPPVVYPYRLQAPGWTYLGEGIRYSDTGSDAPVTTDRVSVGLMDVVTYQPAKQPPIPQDAPDPPQNEIVVQSRNGEGLITRLSIFRWRDTVSASVRERTDPDEILVVPGAPIGSGEWYECLGMFEGNIKIELDTNQVKVYDRTNYRSQVAWVRTYLAGQQHAGYLDNQQALIDPVSYCLEFPFGVPVDVAQSPYPEKIVMAFHAAFAGDTASDYGSLYLTEQAKQKRREDIEWELFSPGIRSSIQQVCVEQLRHDAAAETEAVIEAYTKDEAQTPMVTQEPKPITAQVETVARYEIPGRQVHRFKIYWQLVTQNDMWKIDGILSVIPAQ